MNFSPVRLFQWGAIAFFLVLGAGLYWNYQGKYEVKAGVQVNTSQEGNLPSGLMGYWTFDGDDIVGGTVYDRSGNSKNGTATGTTGIIGKRGQGLLFNGTSDVISLGNVGNGVKTVAFWVKPNTTTQSFIDLNGTATVDVSAATVRGNNFTSPTFYVDGAAPPSSSVAYRSSSATTYATRTNTTLTAPGGIQDGDLLVIVFDIAAASPPTPTPPAGFSVLPNFSSPMAMTAGGFTVNMYAWYKFASSESGNYTVTHASASSQGYIVALSGADPTTPFSPNPTKNTGTGTTTTATGLTTPSDNSLVMFVSSDWGDTTNNLTGPSGSTPTFTKRMGSTSQSGILYVADGVLATAGATGNKTITNNTTGGDPWGGVLISVQPSTAPGPPTIDTNWHHIVITTATGINASAVNLGKIASSYFGGSLDEVQFYSSAFSASEVSQLYAAGQVIVNVPVEDSADTSLVGHWTFDGMDIQGTTAIDRSSAGNHGTITGAVPTLGKLGQGLSFDGSYIAVEDPPGGSLDFGSSGDFSITGWFRTSGGDAVGPIVSKKRNYYDSDIGYMVRHPTAYSTLHFRVSDGTNAFNLEASTETDDGNWHHFAVIWDDDSAQNTEIYLDGVDEDASKTGTITSVGSISNSQPFVIGTDSEFYNAFTGFVDDVRVYNRALSASEILTLYTLGK